MTKNVNGYNTNLNSNEFKCILQREKKVSTVVKLLRKPRL